MVKLDLFRIGRGDQGLASRLDGARAEAGFSVSYTPQANSIDVLLMC